MPRFDVELDLLQRLGEWGLVKESIGGVSESWLKEVFVDDTVELVGLYHYSHKFILEICRFIEICHEE